MSRIHAARRAGLALAALFVIAAAVPSLAGAQPVKLGRLHLNVPQQRLHRHWSHHARGFGATTLTLDPATASALQSLGVTPAPIAPAIAGPQGLRFPITDSLLEAAFTQTITHSGGISLTAGATTVDLENFWIHLSASPTLSADVGSTRVTILNLSLAGAHLKLGPGGLTLGPVTATLTPAAASALNTAFGVTAFTPGLELGTATIRYRLF